MKTPVYIASLLKPNGSKPQVRRVWSLDLESVWLPFFFATNAEALTAIPQDALGAPLRLAYNQDGSVKFGKSGRPTIRVAKPIADNVRLVRDNLAASLTNYAHQVATASTEAYKAEVEACAKEGQPIRDKDTEAVELALAAMLEAQMSETVARAEAPAEVAPDEAPAEVAPVT